MNITEMCTALVKVLAERGQTITTAESCTGGMAVSLLVAVPGASDVLSEAHVTYSGEAKQRILGVSADTLARYTAVSAETAREMAEGARKCADADIAIATTGLAGPGGGDAEHPVGLVYAACASDAGTKVRRFVFSGGRGEIRLKAAHEALRLAWECVSGNGQERLPAEDSRAGQSE